MVSIFNHSPELYISELRNGSQTIEALNDQFRHIAPRIDILSFYETLQTSVGPSKIVCVLLPDFLLNGFVDLPIDGGGESFSHSWLSRRDYEILKC